MTEQPGTEEIATAAIARVMDDLKAFYKGQEDIEAMVSRARSQVTSFTSVEDLASRMVLNVIMGIVAGFKREPSKHREFDFDTLKTMPAWQVLAKDVHALRMAELKSAKVVRRLKRIDVSELRTTFYGDRILKSLNLGRRSMLKQTEYQELVGALRRLNFEVPEIVEPTRTEQFFAEEGQAGGDHE
ncbi:MAG: hypothetical protein GYA24_03050 [Candidatus Lokiarchaeota archaeon]|nr:hypothetical protein [Candidatus Lokiarchaeota archaeon]